MHNSSLMIIIIMLIIIIQADLKAELVIFIIVDSYFAKKNNCDINSVIWAVYLANHFYHHCTDTRENETNPPLSPFFYCRLAHYLGEVQRK